MGKEHQRCVCQGGTLLLLFPSQRGALATVKGRACTSSVSACVLSCLHSYQTRLLKAALICLGTEHVCLSVGCLDVRRMNTGQATNIAMHTALDKAGVQDDITVVVIDLVPNPNDSLGSLPCFLEHSSSSCIFECMLLPFAAQAALPLGAWQHPAHPPSPHPCMEASGGTFAGLELLSCLKEGGSACLPAQANKGTGMRPMSALSPQITHTFMPWCAQGLSHGPPVAPRTEMHATRCQEIILYAPSCRACPYTALCPISSLYYHMRCMHTIMSCNPHVMVCTGTASWTAGTQPSPTSWQKSSGRWGTDVACNVRGMQGQQLELVSRVVHMAVVLVLPRACVEGRAHGSCLSPSTSLCRGSCTWQLS
eukprot:1160942-Pelagomonas_calceolata.AAC.4